MNSTEILITIALVALVTFILRFLPFALFSKKKLPEIIGYYGEVLPYAVMGMLVIYCFKSVNLFSDSYGIPELIASLCVILVHKKWHNMLLSIALGTVTYMLLIQLVF